jgi:hypothetical protein
MADTKISALTAATTLADTDELVIASSGASKKITGANLKASVPGTGGGGVTELSYVEFTSIVTVASTTESSGTLIVTAGAITADGSTPIWVEFFTPGLVPPTSSNNAIYLNLFEGSTNLTRWTQVNATSATATQVPALLKRKLTPTAGSHTYKVTAFADNTTGPAVRAGTGGTSAPPPGYIRITKGG